MLLSLLPAAYRFRKTLFNAGPRICQGTMTPSSLNGVFFEEGVPLSRHVKGRREDANLRELQTDSFLKFSRVTHTPLLSPTRSKPRLLSYQEVQRKDTAHPWPHELTIYFLTRSACQKQAL